MTINLSNEKSASKGMVASPRFRTRTPALAEVIFGDGLDEFIRRFEEVN